MNAPFQEARARTEQSSLPGYDRLQSYEWNYAHAPEPVAVDVPSVPGEWRFCGLSVDSPLGMPAGPLLNGKWVLYYASLGFDVLTYKTVRSRERPCYPLPNLQPVRCGQLTREVESVPVADALTGSWAVSFGMPSKAPDVWRADVETTRRLLPQGKVLSVSVVGSIEPDWGLDELADDYARCARWAVESGADCVETNFSCPNVPTCDGQLYQQPESAALIAARVRDCVGKVPYLVKVGHVTDRAGAAALVSALAPYTDALAMTNSVATTVTGPDGKLLFDGERRGICGDATREASIRQVRLFSEIAAEDRLGLQLIGVGGASTADHVRAYLGAGAEAVHLATAAMLDPAVGLKIRLEMAKRPELRMPEAKRTVPRREDGTAPGPRVGLPVS